MASAYKCDRCGSYYERTAINNTKPIVAIKSFVLDSWSNIIVGDYLDICPYCADSFLNWLKMEEK